MSQTANRFTAAFLAILIQALFLALLILSRPPFTRPQTLVHELTFILPRLATPKTETPPAPVEARGRPRPVVPAPAIAPPVTLPPATSATPSPDLSGLGQSIFGCDLGNLSSLTPEQRARCPHVGDGGQTSDPLGTRSHVQDYAHWAAELAARKSIRVPCTSIEGLAHGAQALMVNPICAMKELEELGKKLR